MFQRVREAASVEYDTEARWESQNKLIPLGVITYATDTHVIKIGDGTSHYMDLPIRIHKVLTPSEKSMLENVNLPNGVVQLTNEGVVEPSLFMGAVSSAISSNLAAHDGAQLAHPFFKESHSGAYK